MDDVLNLRGIYSGKADKTSGMELKNLGEDITAGACARRGPVCVCVCVNGWSTRASSGRPCRPPTHAPVPTLPPARGAGKVTIPVVKALALLPKAEMRAIWDVIKTKPTDRAVVQGVIDKLEACGAIDACITHAQDLVESAFAKLQPLIPDSFSLIMLRAFGWFVSESSLPNTR